MTKNSIYTGITIVVVGGIIWWLSTTPKAPAAPVITEDPQTMPATAPDMQAPVSGPGTTAPITTSTKREKNGMTIETTLQGTGPEIKNGQMAVVDYVGKLQDGTIFDASAKHGQDFSFALGAGQVIKGWDQGVLGMKVGEKRTLTIPPELAYGAQGIAGAIPPNATLVFDVTLKGIK